MSATPLLNEKRKELAKELGDRRELFELILSDAPKEFFCHVYQGALAEKWLVEACFDLPPFVPPIERYASECVAAARAKMEQLSSGGAR